MKKLILLFSFALLAPITNAQESIRQQIQSYSMPKSELIAKSRQMLLDKFKGGDLETVEKTSDYILDSIADKDYKGIWPLEAVLIYYWVGDYSKVIKNIFEVDSLAKASNINFIGPPRDALFKNLIEKSSQEYNKLTAQVETANLAEEKKVFLIMLLNSLILDEPNWNSEFGDQNTLNQKANSFISTYPSSTYLEIVRRIIREEYEERNFGFGVELFTGYGVFTDQLSQNFRNPIAMGFAFDVTYARLFSSFRMYIGIGKTREDISDRNNTYLWEKGDQANTYIPEFNFGYLIYQSPKWAVTPFALVGGTIIDPTERAVSDKPELKKVSISSFSYGLGLSCDFKIKTPDQKGLVRNTTYSAPGYTFLRLRYAYYKNNFGAFSGNFHNITIGFGWYGRGLRPVQD